MALLPKEYLDAVVAIGHAAGPGDEPSWVGTGFLYGEYNGEEQTPTGKDKHYTPRGLSLMSMCSRLLKMQGPRMLASSSTRLRGRKPERCFSRCFVVTVSRNVYGQPTRRLMWR